MLNGWIAHSVTSNLSALKVVYTTIFLLSRPIVCPEALHAWDGKNDKCTRVTTHCTLISPHLNRTCLGNRLPYKLTAPHPVLPEVFRYDLDIWVALRAVPVCWDKLQFFLCSVYLPECVVPSDQPPVPNSPSALSFSANGSSLLDPSKSYSSKHRVILPELEMCEAVHKACPLLVAPSIDKSDPVNHVYLLDPLPRFFDCSFYARGCRQNKLTPQLFQSTGSSCKAPFVTTEVRQNWIPGFDRCSFPCRLPYFDEDHYTLARVITGATSSFCLLLNVFTLVTLQLQKQERTRCLLGVSRLLESSKADLFPIAIGSPTMRKSILVNRHSKSVRFAHSTHIWCFHTPLFYIHLFFIVGCFGWLMPSLPFVGDFVACRDDGSLRTGEPQVSSNKSIFCVVNFMAIYFSLLSAAVWANVFDYVLFLRTRQLVVHLGSHCVPSPMSCRTYRKMPVTPASPAIHPSNFITADGEAALPLVPDLTSDYTDNEHGKVNLSPTEHRSTIEMSSCKQSSSDASLEGGMVTTPHVADQRKTTGVSTASVEHFAESMSCASCHNLSSSRPLVLRMLQLSLPTALFSLRETRHTTSSKLWAKSASFGAPTQVIDCPQCNKSGRKPSDSKRIPRTVPFAPRSACFHTVAFAIPLILVLISLTAAEVDGESLSGICFVGRVNWWVRFGLVLVPCTTSLVVKLVYLSRTMCLFKSLKRRFNDSPYPVDQEFAHRLTRCIPSLGAFLVVAIVIWFYSLCIQFYTYSNEALWSESQRALILCQLSHRLLGLSDSSARIACVHSSSVDRFIQFSPSTSRRSFRYIANGNGSQPLEPVAAVTFGPERLVMSPNHAWISGSTLAKPVIGPLLLHLFAYFALNCLFTSTCLLDRSVKHCWRRALLRLRSRHGLREPESYPLVGVVNDPQSLDAWLISHFTISTTGCSWWDPGIFNLPLTDELLSSVAHFRRSSGVVNSEENRRIELSEVVNDVCTFNSSALKPSTSTIRGEKTTPCVTSASLNPDLLLPPSVPCNEDIIAQLTRLISLYDCSSEDDGPTSLPFRHLLQQLLVSHPAVTTCPIKSLGHSEEPPNLSSHTSITRPQSVQSEQLGIPADSSIGGAQHPPDLVASMAAVYEQCQKHLAALSGYSARRRSRHRRLLPGRLSARRHRSHTGSLSTNGALCSSLLRDGLVSGLGSSLSGMTSEKCDNLTDESLSLLKAAASVVAAASMHGGKDKNQRRSSQCGLPLLPVLPFELSSGAGSACEGSQVSSSSVRSAAAELRVPMLSSVPSLTSRPSSAADTLARHGGIQTDARRSSEHCDPVACLEALGSRMSLRSLSCASSYGAESYNSYRLLLNQSGASWRELWRTRMLLMDVLKWAEAVAPLMQTNRKSRSSLNEVGNNRTTADPSLSRQTTVQVVPEIAGKSDVEWDSRLSQLVTSCSAAGQHPPRPHQCSVGSQPFSQGAPDFSMSPFSNDPNQPNAPLGMDSLMAAAFAAATVAATVAWKQHQQLHRSGSCVTSQAEPTKSPVSHEAHGGSLLLTERQQSNFGVSSSLNSLPFAVPGGTPHTHALAPPFAVTSVSRSSSHCTHPNARSLASSTATAGPRMFQPTYANGSNSAHCLCSVPHGFIPYHGYPCGVMAPPPAGYRVSPDLLVDHDRSGIAFVSPNYTPPFVTAASQTSSFHHSSDRSPQFKSQSFPVQPSFPPGFDGIMLQDGYSDNRQPVSYAHFVAHNAEPPPNNRQYQNVAKSSEELNDSDAFDSEDEVMSTSETPAVAQPLEREERSSCAPLIPLVYPGAPANQAYYMPLYSPISPDAVYPFYCPPQHSDCMAPSSILGGADDGEVSTVSQSASQVVPREPSPSNDEQNDYCPSATACPISVDPPHSLPYSTDSVKRLAE